MVQSWDLLWEVQRYRASDSILESPPPWTVVPKPEQHPNSTFTEGTHNLSWRSLMYPKGYIRDLQLGLCASPVKVELRCCSGLCTPVQRGGDSRMLSEAWRTFHKKTNPNPPHIRTQFPPILRFFSWHFFRLEGTNISVFTFSQFHIPTILVHFPDTTKTLNLSTFFLTQFHTYISSFITF